MGIGLAVGAGVAVGVIVVDGVFATFFQISFLPDLTHVNFEPLDVCV
jgi:hypothetical protein